MYLRTIFPWYTLTPSFKSRENLLELIKKRSKVHEEKRSCERALNVNQWKTFSKIYKPIRFGLTLIDKITHCNCFLWQSLEFIQTQNRHPTSLDKTSIRTGRILLTSSQKVSREAKGGLTRNDLYDTICMSLIRFMTTFILLKSLHINLKR